MPKPACDCTTPLHWFIAYLSKSPTDDEPIAIEIHCDKHKVGWWWKIENPPQTETGRYSEK